MLGLPDPTQLNRLAGITQPTLVALEITFLKPGAETYLHLRLLVFSPSANIRDSEIGATRGAALNDARRIVLVENLE